MKGVILDSNSLGDLDLSAITDLLDDWDVYGTTQPDETLERVSNADIVLTNKIPLGGEILGNSPGLQHISVMATGINNIDLDAARKAHITVSNAVAYATPSVVQHTMTLMLALATSVPTYIADVRQGKWQQAGAFCMLNHPISELNGKVLGIVGYGELGSNVAKVAQAFGMNIRIAGRDGNRSDDRKPLDELLPTVDYLSLHCPLNEHTRDMINASTLAKMKPTAYLLNTARGGLVNSTDLIDALTSGQIAGAAVDVLDSEPPGADEPLTMTPLQNLIVTPHNAWGAIESRNRLIQQMVENINGFLADTPLRVVS